ncbi:hypothetical protein BC834DRAFT_76937 [Gloeopeniophorella convolvens]|nr:hypothetical protein BC834DRAFT_76937 [Gloeopeniophorella convolvens]
MPSIPSPSSTSNALSASASGSSGTSSSKTTVSSGSGMATTSSTSSSPTIPSISSGSVRRAVPRDDKTASVDKSKDSVRSTGTASKRSSPTVPSPLAQSHTSGSPPYASPSSFSASTTFSPPSLSPPSSLSSSSPKPASRAIVPMAPTPANIFALQTENADLRAELSSLRSQLENAERLSRRREREIRGLRWLVVNWGGEKKEASGLAAFPERRPSGDNGEAQEEVQEAVRYLRAESESGYGSGSVSGSQSRMSHSSAYSSIYPAESVSDGSGSDAGMARRAAFGPGPSARASEDQALDAIPERAGGEDTETEEERRRRKDERRASRALKRISVTTTSDSLSAAGNGLDDVVAQALYSNTVPHGGRAMSIEQIIEGDRTRRERVGLKGMDEVLEKLRVVAGVADAKAASGTS